MAPAADHRGIALETIEVARAGEPERYVAATLAPPEHRAALIALAAFSADLRRVPTLVKEPFMGEIRLQWWRDAIAAGGDGAAATGHPIADALERAVRKYGLPREALIAMTEARAFDLYPDPMPNAATLDGYLGKTEGVPFALATTVLLGGAGADSTATDIAGRVFGLARLLADLSHWQVRGRNPLPLGDDAAATRLNVAIDDAVRDIRDGYTQMRSRWRDLPPGQRMALLPMATIPAYLAGLDAAGRDPRRTLVELVPLSRVWRIARARWVGL